VVGGVAMRMEASYVVEALDSVTVPAGTFEALRIVRRVRFVGAGDQYLTRAQIVWYAPSVGSEVRQLIDDTLVEMVSFEKAPTQESAPAAR
jgi:hypothetical protein